MSKLKCIVCGKLINQNKYANGRQKYCTLKCRSKHYYKKYYDHFTWVEEISCPICKKLFEKNNINQKFCSDICRKKNWKNKHRNIVLKNQREYNKRRKLDNIAHKKDLESRKRWRKNNKDKKYSYKRSYRARKYGNGGYHTKKEWLLLKKKFNYTCQMCGKKEPEIKLTEDHIKPLSKGGNDYIKNIQPLCRYCNSYKNDRILISLPQTNE